MNIKQKIYLISGLALIIMVLLVWAIMKPLVLETRKTSGLVKERNEKLSILRRTDQEYLKRLESDYAAIEQDISLIKSGFLDVNQAVGFFIDLENIASATSNELEIEVKEFPYFNLYLLGNFPNLMKFLAWLENSKYFLDVNSIKINRFSQRDLSPEQLKTVSEGDVKTILEIKNYTKNLK